MIPAPTLCACAALLAGGAALAAETAQVEVGDCAEFRPGPICELDDARRLTLWVPAAPEAITLSADGARLTPLESRPVDAGARLTIEVPPRTAAIALSADGGPRYRLAVVPHRRDAAALRADALLAEGDYDAALDVIAAALPNAGAAARGELLRARGRIYLRRGLRAAAEGTLGEAIRSSRAAGRGHNAVLAANALAFSLMHGRRDFGAARRLIESFPASTDGHAEARYFRHYDLGLIAFNAGDARNALRHLDAAAGQARRLGWGRYAINAESILAVQLQRLGRRERASALLERRRDSLPTDLPGCEEAHYFTNLGWSRLLALDAGEPAGDPTADLQTALALTDRHCGPNDRANARINLALADYHAGRYGAAGDSLAAAREQTDAPPLYLVLWRDDLAARIALAQGRPDEALALFERLETLAAATLSPSARWRAAVGRAQALAAAGEREAAIDAYASAEAALDSDLLRVPLDSGRETLLAARSRAGRDHLALLLAAGREPDAHALARRSHSRALRAVHLPQRLANLSGERRAAWEAALARYRAMAAELGEGQAASWMLPADELQRRRVRREQAARALRSILDEAVTALGHQQVAAASPAPTAGELDLLIAPLPAGEALFASDAEGLTVLRPVCTQPDTDARAECLLQGIGDRLVRADALRVAAYGALADVDYHALVVDGETLAARLPIVYAAGLPAAGAAPVPQGHALLVADPRNDLRNARNEVDAVDRLLRDSGAWSSEVLVGDLADAASVAERLARSDLFHYAGHARFAGDAGWRSALALAGESRLDVADILALGRAPALVVLSGCETAGAPRSSGAQQFSLAHAFLAGGAAGVIATSRPVADRSAQLLVSDFYRAWTGGQPTHVAFNHAQRRLRTQHADPDWAAFRLLEP